KRTKKKIFRRIKHTRSSSLSRGRKGNMQSDFATSRQARGAGIVFSKSLRPIDKLEDRNGAVTLN
ncbi:MAG: hypothetical protein RR182_07075, partial [Alistipes sp.]